MPSRCAQRLAPLLVATLIIAVPAAAEETASSPSVLVARVYQTGLIPPLSWQTALATASAVLQRANIQARWLICDAAPHHQQDACAQPLGPHDISVRLVRMPTPGDYIGQLPLGYSLVDTESSRGALATIYLDRVRWLAGAAQIDLSALLGLAIVHEIGHLVLGTTNHTDAGVMRPIWTQDTLARSSYEDWLFTDAEAALLRQRLGM